MGQLRIYLLSDRLSGRGGMETVLVTVSKELLRRGHDVRMFLFDESIYPEWERDLPVFHISKGVRFSANVAVEVNPLVGRMILFGDVISRAERPDILIALDAWSVACARMIAQIYEIPPKVLSWIHLPIGMFGNKELFRLADAHLSVSESARRELLTVSPGGSAYVVHNPVPVTGDVLSHSAHTTFLFVGRIVNHQKRLDLLFHALRGMLAWPWSVDIIGTGSDEQVLKDLARGLGIESRLTWHGWKENPWDAITSATVLVLPSDYEPFGLVLVEALARGVPVVASNCPGGPTEIVHPRVNGFLFPTGNVEALRQLLTDIVTGAADLPSSDACRGSVQRFMAEKIMDLFEAILLAAIESNGH